ncbi:MAG: hypothetical protein RXO24_05380 [Acidilobus sp.]|jgi:hypothetical protein
MSEGKAPLHVMIPIEWKEELERMAKEKNVSIADVARELIDQGLHGKAQPEGCNEDASHVMGQLYNIAMELLAYYGELYKVSHLIYEALNQLNEASKKHFEIALRLNSLYRGMAAKENKS